LLNISNINLIISINVKKGQYKTIKRLFFEQNLDILIKIKYNQVNLIDV